MEQASPGAVPRGPAMDDGEAEELSVFFENQRPEPLLAWAFERFGPQRFALVSSFQAEAMVLIHMAWQVCRDVRVVTVDTGRLPQETYELIDQVREMYGIPVEVVLPDNRLVGQMVNEHGPNLFYKSVSLRIQCCHVRKVLPLQGILRHLDAWATGIRRGQAATRGHVRKVAVDHAHGGVVKLSPLADWSGDEVWAYIRRHGIPYHRLYGQGYASIGCAPCTRPVQQGEDARSGRWWWETGAPKECGMHRFPE